MGLHGPTRRARVDSYNNSGVKHRQSDFITAPEKILKALTHSKSTGNVLAICAEPFGKFMCLTAIEDIQNIPGEHTHDKLVILKKYDLQGSFIDDHELCLSEIVKVRPFKRKYDNKLSLFFHSDESSGEGHVIRIRKLEQSVSLHELRIILIKIINSGYRITINRKEEIDQFRQSCYVRDFTDAHYDTMIVSSGIGDDETTPVPLNTIASIIFESFFYYKGFASRVFRVCA
jgi:hypothetical protein